MQHHDEGRVQVNNLIPKYQADNQRFSDLKEVFDANRLPKFAYETDAYTHIRNVISKRPEDIRIDVVNGIHQPQGDYFHFNIRVYDRRQRPHVVTHDNLHVYVMPMVMADARGNPVLTWYLNPDFQITG